jgi:hypothetical protein
LSDAEWSFADNDNLGESVMRTFGRWIGASSLPRWSSPARAIREYLRDGRARFNPEMDCNTLFIGRLGKGITRQEVYYRICDLRRHVLKAQDRLTELNQRLAFLQAKDNPLDAEEFVRLYQERRALLKQLGLGSQVDDVAPRQGRD